jgi:hypothetical protein
LVRVQAAFIAGVGDLAVDKFRLTGSVFATVFIDPAIQTVCIRGTCSQRLAGFRTAITSIGRLALPNLVFAIGKDTRSIGGCIEFQTPGITVIFALTVSDFCVAFLAVTGG